MIELALPWPPSINHYWRTWRGRVLLSREGRAYREAVGRALQGYRAPPLTGRLEVRLVLHPPDRRRFDIDNRHKAPLDAMQHAGVFGNDEQIDALRIERGDVVPHGRVDVCLEDHPCTSHSIPKSSRPN